MEANHPSSVVVLASDPDGLPGTPVIDAGSNASGNWWGLTKMLSYDFVVVNASCVICFEQLICPQYITIHALLIIF